MFKTLALVVVVAIAALLGYAATKPDTFQLERATTINAPPERIFPLINDFQRWRDWSPWEKMDPAMQRTLSGATKGQGAVYAWSGNRDVGEGRMEITESNPYKRIVVKLDFTEPFEAHNVADFRLTPRGQATEVNWRMVGPNPFMAKVANVFFDMEGMVGKDFEAGLANLKAAAEKSAN